MAEAAQRMFGFAPPVRQATNVIAQLVGGFRAEHPNDIGRVVREHLAEQVIEAARSGACQPFRELPNGSIVALANRAT